MSHEELTGHLRQKLIYLNALHFMHRALFLIELKLKKYIYIYTYICICVCVYIYIYIQNVIEASQQIILNEMKNR